MADLWERIRSGTLAGVMLVLVLVLSAAAPGASAGNGAVALSAQQTGLMWNRSGLPAVFPLQVKTPPGRDYFLTLIDQDTGDAALAAYIKGGEFFKVLVPPGVFRLSFAAGDVWQGEEDLFGPGAKTDLFELRRPLTFETRGHGTKAGHVVSLSERRPGLMAQITLKDQLICQFVRLEGPPPIYFAKEREQARDFWQHGRARSGYATGPDGSLVDRPGYPTGLYRYFQEPRYDVRSQYCG